MGTSCTFKCNKCGYNVVSTGDFDYGMVAVLRPYICNDCNIVTDSLVGIQGMEYPKKWIENPKGDEVPDFVLEAVLDEEYSFYTCEECNGDNLTLWNPKWRKCPKCSGRMKIDKDGMTVDWD